jgi:hypothetical protein
MAAIRGMILSMETLTKLQKRDIRLLGKFVEVYCAGKHGELLRSDYPLPEGLGQRILCSECREFMAYAISRRQSCPLESEKPTCKNCRIHCYAAPERAKVREIMSFAGRRLMMRGRLDYLWHYFF